MRRDHLPLAAILGVAIVLRLWEIGFGLPHSLTRPDEEAVASIALRFFSGTLNPAFFDWPSLFMYLVGIGYAIYFNVGRLFGWFPYEASFLTAAAVTPAPLFLIARVLSAAAGVLTVGVVYRIGRRLFDRTTALVAAAFLAVAALHVRDSHFGLTDVTATLFLAASFLFTVAYAQSGRRRDALLSALWAGLAASTKYNAGIVILPGLWAIARSRAGDGRGRATAVRLSVLYVAVASAAFLVGTPYALLDAPSFLLSLRNVAAHMRGGHIAMAGYAWRVHLGSSLRYGLGLPMLAAGIGGVVLYGWRDRRAGLLFGMTPVVYFAIVGAGQTAFARYIIPAVPFLCLAAAYFTVESAHAIGRWSRRPGATVALIGVLAALVAAPSTWSAIQTDRLLSRVDNRLLAAQWIHDQFREGATLYQSGLVYGHVQMQTSGAEARDRYPEVTFNEERVTFHDGEGKRTDPPEIIVMVECPLAYCNAPPQLQPVLEEYLLRRTFTAVDTTQPGLVYDREDAFFVPLAGFDAVARPGPNVMIYERRIVTAGDPRASPR